jgi:hypothetical protein
MPILTPKSILWRALCMGVLACPATQAGAGGPAFLLSVSNSTSRLSEMLQVTTAPFGTTVIATTNAGFVTTNAAGWSALAFGPRGTLYGVTQAGRLAVIDPGSAASSILTDLRATNGALVPATGLAFSTNGSAYVSDGVNLYSADLASGSCSNIGAFSGAGAGGPPLALAQAPDGAMFGLFLGFDTVNLTNARLSQIGSSLPFGDGAHVLFAKGAAFGSDSNLYMVGWDGSGADHPKLYLVKTNNGTLTALGSLPFGSAGLAALSLANPGPPAIVLPPASRTAAAGDTVTLSVTAGGTPAPMAQWYFDGSVDSGATNFALALPGVSPTNAGSYFVVLTNSDGAVTSAVVTLTVTAPILAGTGAYVYTSGSAPAASRAVARSSILDSSTNFILGLTTNPPTETVFLNSNLFFSCLCFAPNGELFGAGEYFTAVGPAPGPGPQPQAVMIEGVDALYQINSQTWTTNFIGNFQTNGGQPGQIVPAGMASSPSGVLYASWAGGLYTVDTNNALMTLVGAFSPAVIPAPSHTRQTTSFGTNAIPVIIGGIAFAPDGALYGGETNLYTINPTNAVVVDVGALGGVSASILADMKYGADGFLYFFDGASDGNLYRLNPADAQVSIAANFPSTLSGLAFVPVPAAIVAQPANQFVRSGAAAAFSVTAAGTAPLECQWYFKGSKIPRATNLVLTITNVLAKNEGSYFAVVTNPLAAVTSSVVQLETYTLPSITQPPKSAVVITSGGRIALGVKAAGGRLAWQWQLNGSNLPGQTAASLAIPDAGTNDAGTYTIQVFAPYVAAPATASSDVAVIPKSPAISYPADNSATGGNLTVTGREPPNGGAASIQWRLNTGAPQSAIVSSNGRTWIAAVALAPGTNVFSVWATNSWGASDTVRAKYVLNPFIPVAGAYSGLFQGAAPPAFSNAGYFHLTLASDRAFTGYLLLDGARTPFSGRFDTNGAAALVAVGAPGRLLDLAMQLDLSGVNPLTGVVSNAAQSWTASLSAIRAAFGGASRATNFQGDYVLAMNMAPGSLPASAAPPGASFATATISAAGTVTLKGTMADGAAFTDTGSAISQDGDWPLYASLFSGKGSVLAWLKFPRRSDSSQMTSGQALWFESARTNSHYYTNGFSLLTNQLGWLLNRRTAPPRGVAVLTNVNYTVQIFGGGLGAPLVGEITIRSNNAVVLTPPNTNDLSITINAAAGSFSGSFANPVTGGTTKLRGVFLPESDEALGYFLGTNEAGGIVIEP